MAQPSTLSLSGLPILYQRFLLFWVHSRQSTGSRLPLNIVREALEYLPSAVYPFAVSLSGNFLRVFSLIGGGTQTAFISVCGSPGATLCVQGVRRVWAVAAKPQANTALSISLQDYQVRREQGMHRCREAPGVCLYGGFIYVFGGKGALSRVEKLDLRSRTWQNLPDMIGERSYFSPALHKEAIYLLDSLERSATFEQFLPSIDSFTALNVCLDSLQSRSITIITEDGEVLILSSDGSFGHFSLRKLTANSPEKVSPTVTRLPRDQQFIADSSLSPSLVSTTVCWIDRLSGAFHRFSLSTQTFSICNL